MYSTRKYYWGHYFYVSYWRRDRHFTLSSEPHEGLTACSTKRQREYLHFSVILRPWVLVQPRESNPRPPAQHLSALPIATELTLLRSRFWCFRLFPLEEFFFSLRRHTNLSKLKAAVACKIFDTVISPIPTYISEIWGVYAKPDFKTWANFSRNRTREPARRL